MKNEIYTRHRCAARLQVSDISNIEFNLVCHIRIVGLVLVTHIVLLLFITGEDANFTNICAEETLQDSISEGSCASAD